MNGLAVIVVDATASAHVGADVERYVKVFPMPAGMAEYIKSHTPPMGSVVVALVDGEAE